MEGKELSLSGKMHATNQPYVNLFNQICNLFLKSSGQYICECVWQRVQHEWTVTLPTYVLVRRKRFVPRLRH